jgi:hypothetical protein
LDSTLKFQWSYQAYQFLKESRGTY